MGSFSFGGSIGFELVINFETRESSSFLYGSASGGKSVGATAHGLVYIGGVGNLEKGNYDYRGSFKSLSGAASDGPFGIAVGHAWVPGDNPFDPRQPYTDYIGWAPGLGIGGGYSESVYVPIFTNNWETGQSSWDVIPYFQELSVAFEEKVTNVWNNFWP